MSLRVIAGSAKGRRLAVPDLPELRPTTDRLRQVLFDILGDTPRGARVLDLFAGSGALGIEALSRGAAEATFVERHPLAVAAIRANLAVAGFTGQVLRGDVSATLRRLKGTYDLAFLDPPYSRGLGFLDEILTDLADRGTIRTGGTIVVEAAGQVTWPSGFREVRRRRAGSTTLLVATLDEHDSDLPGNL